MYRVKAEAVSGKSVFADGKWLRCIGNKIVRAGDFVWTDGRCVYGNHKEAQQPLVITAPDNDITAIPIATWFYNHPAYPAPSDKHTCFTFSRKLKPVGDEKNVFNRNTLFINDTKSAVYSLPSALQYTPFYMEKNYIAWAGVTYYDDYIDSGVSGFLAANIKNDILFSVFLKDISVQIRKDTEIITEISLRPTIEQVINDCPQADPRYSPYDANIFTTDAGMEVAWAFIDDDSHWAFLVSCHCSTGAGNGEAPESVIPRTEYIGENAKSYSLTRDVFFSSDNDSPLISREINMIKQNMPYSPRLLPIFTDQQPNIIHFPLQDGFYFTTKPAWGKVNTTSEYDDTIFIDGKTAVDENAFMYYLGDISIFSPAGNKILSFLGNSVYPLITFCKIKSSKYLLGYSERYREGIGFATNTDKSILCGGLFLYNQDNLELLIGSPCLNQRLRPMKKFKNWQNRIKDFPLPET